LNKVSPEKIALKPEFTRNFGIFAIKKETFNSQKSVGYFKKFVIDIIKSIGKLNTPGSIG